jgi:putative ABC transport system permease protein
VTGAAGPWAAAIVPVEKGATHLAVTFGFNRELSLSVLGRDSPGGALDRVDLVRGKWVAAPGEIVVTRAYANQNSLSLGDRLTALATSGKPVLTVVGEAVDVDPRLNRAWVTSGQVGALNATDAPLNFQMSYRFGSAPSSDDIRSAVSRLKSSVPEGAVLGYGSYLDFRDNFNMNTSLVLTFLLAFAAMALASVAVIVGNVVTGAVLASYREIGVMKAIGFTPIQVVMVFVLAMLVPALAAGVIAVPIGALASKPLLDQAAEAVSLPSPSPVVPLIDLLALVIPLAAVIAAATLPAWRAGRLSPVEAIVEGTAPSGRWSALLQGRLGWWKLPRPLALGIGDAFARPFRAGLTALAILAGVATLVFASGLYSAINRFNDLFAPANGSSYQVTISRFGGYSDADMTGLLRQQPETFGVVGHQQINAEVPGKPDLAFVTVFKGDSARLGYNMDRGRWLADSGEAVIGTTFNPYHWAVGQTITTRVAGRPLDLRIVGSCYCYFALGFDWATYNLAVPDAQPNDYVVQLRPGTNPDAYVKRISEAQPDFLFAEANQTNTGLDIENILNGMVAALALILGAIAALGVFNSLLLTTRERARDIAIVKTLGMTPRQVEGMVLASALALGVVGAIVGVPVGIVLYNYLIQAMAALANFTLSNQALIGEINPINLVEVALAGILVALAGAILPARWAARAPVVSVLNLE